MIKTIAMSVVLAVAASAAAQPKPPDAVPPPKTDEQSKAEAKRLYDEGLKHYNLGEYDAAITKFKAAYAISSAVGLLFNIAQSYRLKKDYEQASNFYLTYLRLKPDAPNRGDVEQRIDEMAKLLEEQKAMEKKPPSGTVPPEGGNTPSVHQPKDPNITVNLVNPQTEHEGGGTSLKTAGYATAGAGAALVITGLVFGKMAKSAEQDLNKLSTDMGTWTQAQQDKYDAGKRDNTIAVISFIAGGAAIATGGTLWVLGALKKHDAHVAVVPSKQGGGTVAVGWSF